MSAKKVTKYDLIEAIYQDSTGYEKKVVQDVLELLLQNIKGALKDGSTIELRGFGTF
ncbi:MAG: HU family DNA-binding protein, partial [Treponema sp.]|nr:HU family DNA-binding protein [Treponema sp.]